MKQYFCFARSSDGFQEIFQLPMEILSCQKYFVSCQINLAVARIGNKFATLELTRYIQRTTVSYTIPEMHDWDETNIGWFYFVVNWLWLFLAAKGRSRVCRNFYCSLLLTGMCAHHTPRLARTWFCRNVSLNYWKNCTWFEFKPTSYDCNKFCIHRKLVGSRVWCTLTSHEQHATATC